ncbi:MAG: PmoA family protein [Gemmataceae bacterium]|nr:PmoA family protein [Gemmataceae bacterium]
MGSGSLTAAKDGDAVVFRLGDQVVGKYHVGPDAAKPHLWPVTAPGGVHVTRAWPVGEAPPGGTVDHPHHKSAWFCHGDVIPEGVTLKEKSSDKRVHGVDFWSEAKGHGRMVCVEVKEPEVVGPGHVKVATRNEWRTPDGVKVLDEDRVIHLRELPAGRLWVWDCTLKATAGPVAFGDTKEGSFGIRVHDALSPAAKGGGAVATSDGQTIPAPVKDDLPIWGRPADWVDYSGTVDGKPVGVAVFEHPDNPARGGWHARAYGLLACNPFARAGSGFPSQKGKTDLFRVEKGGELRLRYAVYAHTGDAAAGKVAEAYQLFAR